MGKRVENAQKMRKTVKDTSSQTTDLQLALADVFESGLTQANSANEQITQLQLALVELYESTI